MVVLKFGGSSVATPEAIRSVVSIVRRRQARAVVVVSALAKVTDALLDAADRAAKGELAAARRALDAVRARHLELAAAVLASEPELRSRVSAAVEGISERAGRALAEVARRGDCSDRDRDEIAAAGEDLAAEVVAAALRAAGCAAEPVDARRVIWTDARFGGAEPQRDRIEESVARELAPRLDSAVVVVQGFVGACAPGTTTTLGRGGSDTTAALLGAALRAEEIQIWTDVDGILSADPRVVPSARVVPEMGFEEAIELAYFGARVLHPAAAKHATAAGVPLRILNTFNPGAPGTLIQPGARSGAGVAAVAYRGGTALVTVRSLPMFMAHGFLARVFDVFARRRLAVDLVATSHTSTSFTVGHTVALDEALDELRPFCETAVERGFATFSVIGRGLLQEVGIVARVFAALDEIGVRLVTQASDVSLNFLVAEGEAPRCARRLHEALIERRAPAAGARSP